MAVDGSEGNLISQDDVIALLSSPNTFGTNSVERVDTHLAHIFLAGNRAYKLKRPVRLNFVDFTTSEQRRRACQRELQINKKAAGEIYRAVIPIVLRCGSLHLGGDGVAVDWVVEMERFDRRLELDRLADQGQLDESVVIDLADTVAHLHLSAAPNTQLGGYSAVVGTIRQIADALREAILGASQEPLINDWEQQALAHANRNSRLLDSRRNRGYVRHCHGDLHLANVCLYNGRPTPFDALEFSDEMATTDVLYDIAFTLMDLVHRDEPRLANSFLNRYLSATRDYAGLSLLPVFISMRAAVRALANALANDPRANTRKTQTYLEHAMAELAEKPPARLIAIGGLSGTGKSTVANEIAPTLSPGVGAIVLRSDVTRKRLFDIHPEDALPANAYHRGVSETVHRRMMKDARRALMASQMVILDATFMLPEHRDACAHLARQVGVSFNGFWLEAETSQLAERIDARQNDASDATVDVLAHQATRDTGAIAWQHIDAGRSISLVSAQIESCLQTTD